MTNNKLKSDVNIAKCKFTVACREGLVNVVVKAARLLN